MFQTLNYFISILLDFYLKKYIYMYLYSCAVEFIFMCIIYRIIYLNYDMEKY